MRLRRILSGALVLAGLTFCLGVNSASTQQSAGAREDDLMGTARLTARPNPAPGEAPGGSGLSWLEGSRPPAIYAPAALEPGRPAPLVILLHGAGGGAADILPLMQEEADRRGFLLLVPQSQGRTWDVILSGYGDDVAAIDRALSQIFGSYRVDPDRVAVAGFSDGASYALSIGLANGGLFSDVLAFSPGFIAPAPPEGAPAIFISHGDQDRVLPIDRCSRRIVPLLRQAGYEVDYREFAGGHVVPTEMVRAALDRFVGAKDTEPR